MSAPRHEPNDSREWLARAKSNLRLASVRDEAVYPEELCYNAQQAAEKAIKGVFVKLGREFPYTHNLAL
jgi:HEPN domain-containing protein